MTDRLIRLMRIITLVQAKPGILARELAERCGSSERTIYRDMDALSAMHIPITHLGHGKGYAFIGNFALYPLDFSEEEASAFSQLRGIMKEIKPLLPPDFESAYEKILAAEYKHKTEREENMESVKKETGLSRKEWGSLQAEPLPGLTEIISSVMKQRSVRADYCENAAEETGILIDPYCLIPLENRYHLIGYCHRFKTLRAFHISGFSSVAVLPRRFVRKPFDLQAFMEHKWRLEQDSVQIDFKVRFSERAMDWVMQGGSPVQPNRLDLEQSCLYFRVGPGEDISVVRWVMEFAEEAEILEPAHYRDWLKNQLDKWLQLYK
ncbi:helix-turn-helix transcriptional regulator [Paenibacillus tengchongensis]|uniref:helix-turn-helix transcriptional regulator n=1 Tax=Paenibacillus tengchongensis TaxID=2608684 RepID=UPI00124E74B3|nr:WYL domain-containing protein [Paenibacillus tengchongensis]